MPRKRAAETRSAETRAADVRRMPQVRYQGKLYFPQEKIPRGMVYRWIRESLLNEPDPSNMTDRLISGWKPVPADRHPEYVPPPLPGVSDVSSVIRRGGQILCEKPFKDWSAERRQLQEENRAIMQDVAWTGQNDPALPRQDFGSTVEIERVTAERGASFKED